MSDIINVPMAQQRDINTITTEIRTLTRAAQRMALEYGVEIGRRLHEAKEMLPHGQWGEWLKTEVEFSHSTANNFMRLFDAYADEQITLDGAVTKSQALGNLSVTKALRLLALPEEEREEFVTEHDVEAMSTRELEAALEKEKAARKTANEKLKNMKENTTVAPEVLERLKSEADGYAQAAKTAEDKLAAMEKRMQLADPDMVLFKQQFEAVQEAFNKLPPDVRAVVGTPMQLKEWAMMESDVFASVVASNFQKAYRARAERARNDRKLPSDVKALVSALSDVLTLSDEPKPIYALSTLNAQYATHDAPLTPLEQKAVARAIAKEDAS